MRLVLQESRSLGTPIGLLGKGVLAGVTGTAAMTLAQTQLMPRIPFSKLPSAYEPKEPRYPDEVEAKEEPATEVAARRFVEGVAHRRLTGKQKKWAGHAVHFATGAVFGGLFSLLAPRKPKLHHGLLWGTFVWAVNDNLVLPLLRVADWPSRYRTDAHLQALLAHLIYGVGTAYALRLELR